MNTSASRTSARSAVLPTSERKSSTTLRLPRLTLTKTPLIPGAGPTEMKRVLSPSGGSILITSAPISAMICVQYGPITIAVRSTTHTPASGPLGILHRHSEAVPDVIAVTVGHHRENHRLGRVPDRCDVLAHLRDGPRRPIHARRLGDDGLGHPARQRDEHFSSDRTGFVRQPPNHRRDQLWTHRRVGGGIDALSPSCDPGGGQHNSLFTPSCALPRRGNPKNHHPPPCPPPDCP